jgi:predicted DNA-binding transcriptional regulator AlpA
MSAIEFVRPSQAFQELGVSNATGWRWVKLKLLPEPVKLGPNSTAFIRAELERAKSERIKSARAVP